MISFNQKLYEIMPNIDFFVFASPIFFMVIAGFVALLVGIFRSNPEEPNYPGFGIAITSCLGALVAPILFWKTPMQLWLGGAFLQDFLSNISFLTIALGTLFTLLIASTSNSGRRLLRPEMLTLILFASAGMMGIASSGEFLTFFINLEITSISFYIMVGYQRNNLTTYSTLDNRSFEASVKYFLMGATASGIILLGMAFIYLHTASLSWQSFANLTLNADKPLAIFGIVLFILGICFKFSLAPFHFWAPDVYEGSHATLTGYMSTMFKLAIAFVILRILSVGFTDSYGITASIFWMLGIISIAVGSFYGLVQPVVKRLLAYSSIANAGYFCLAFSALALNRSSQISLQSVITWAVLYAIITMGAFAVVAWLDQNSELDLTRENLVGLGKNQPFMAFSFSIFILGLAGIPPLAGFFGKFFLISSAVSENLIGLAVVMVLLSCISLYYYLSILVDMWFKEPTKKSIINLPTDTANYKRMKLILIFLCVLTAVYGVIGPRFSYTGLDKTSYASNTP